MKLSPTVFGKRSILNRIAVAGFGLALWTGMDTANIGSTDELRKRILHQLAGLAVICFIGIMDVVLALALILRI